MAVNSYQGYNYEGLVCLCIMLWNVLHVNPFEPRVIYAKGYRGKTVRILPPLLHSLYKEYLI